MFSSPFQRALARGMKPGGDLFDELSKLDDSSVESKKDARAVCKALVAFPLDQSSDETPHPSPLHTITSLFEDVAVLEPPAYEVFYHEGLPQLIRIFDGILQRNEKENVDDLLFILEVLAMYGSLEGAQKVVEAARRPFSPDASSWHSILAGFSSGNPQRDFVYRELSDPLPPGSLAVALLDSANRAAIESELQQHPFDSPAGWEQLQSWLEDSDPDHVSYAHSATAALPFIENPARDQLLALAMDHADTNVQVEAAWVAGKLGREGGFKILTRFCLDVNHSEVAQRYLAELEREDLIPEEARNASFQAKADFARWLAHPNELGKSPDELEIVDHRQLAWPPDRELKPFWVIRFRVRDRTGLEEDHVGCGMIGSMTWCFFSYEMNQRPPEDVYAIHCYSEMEHTDLIEEKEITDGSEYARLLNQWHGAPLESAKITRVAEVSPKLKTPSRLVAVATAKQSGEDGWVVLDGPRSAWYSESEQPDSSDESIVLKIHVGRQVLGFQEPSDRKKYLITARPSRSPQDVISAYEKFLFEASNCAPKRQEQLLGDRSEVARHFDAYVDAIVQVEGSDKSETVIRVYDHLRQLVAQADETIRNKLYDSFGVLGENFDKYVDALISRNRGADIGGLIGIFAPHWEHNLGYGRLGSAAFKAGDVKIAEPFFLKLRDELEAYYRAEEMSMLAEIWHDRGELQEARELLIDCLKKIVVKIKESKYNSDRKMFANEFRHHRSTYLRLFHNGETELAARGVPVEPL